MSARRGLRIANRRKGVNIDKTCLVSPLARINARGAKLEVGANCEIAPYTILQGNVSIGSNSSTFVTRQGEVRWYRIDSLPVKPSRPITSSVRSVPLSRNWMWRLRGTSPRLWYVGISEKDKEA
jgi:hypothetical protein